MTCFKFREDFETNNLIHMKEISNPLKDTSHNLYYLSFVRPAKQSGQLKMSLQHPMQLIWSVKLPSGFQLVPTPLQLVFSARIRNLARILSCSAGNSQEFLQVLQDQPCKKVCVVLSKSLSFSNRLKHQHLKKNSRPLFSKVSYHFNIV